MRAIIFTALIVALAGCGLTPQGDIFRAVAEDKGGDAMDKGLENAEWFLCNAVSVGAIRRRYGEKPKKIAAYNTLCLQTELNLITRKAHVSQPH